MIAEYRRRTSALFYMEANLSSGVTNFDATEILPLERVFLPTDSQELLLKYSDNFPILRSHSFYCLQNEAGKIHDIEDSYIAVTHGLKL